MLRERGNTGIGLAVIGGRGICTVIVIPNNQSREKMHLLRTLGAEVKGGAGKAYRIRKIYNTSRRRLSRGVAAGLGNQFDNTANRRALRGNRP